MFVMVKLHISMNGTKNYFKAYAQCVKFLTGQKKKSSEKEESRAFIKCTHSIRTYTIKLDTKDIAMKNA